MKRTEASFNWAEVEKGKLVVGLTIGGKEAEFVFSFNDLESLQELADAVEELEIEHHEREE